MKKAKANSKFWLKFAKIGIAIMFCFGIFVAGFFVIRAKIYPKKYLNEINVYATKYNLAPSLVASVVNTESSFNKNARSSKGAIGLMQVKLSTAKYMIDLYNLNLTIDENELFEINNNLNFGCMYLRYLINKFLDVNTALASYNAGETIVRYWLKDEKYSSNGKTLKTIPYNETENYVKKINRNLKYYKKVM